VNKTAASAAQSAFYFVLISLFTYIQLQLTAETKTSYSLAYLTSCHNSIFGDKLRTIEAENP